MPNMWLVVIQLVMLFLRNAKSHENCPDGVCEEALAEGEALKAQVQSPNVSFGLFDTIRFLRCFPMDRVFAVFKRVVALLKGCQQCPAGECSFFDILSCLDLKEAVAIAQEVLAIIRDSRVCDSGRNEITLGEAAS
jgi:hypothetical protein